jgi:hypothetical protein
MFFAVGQYPGRMLGVCPYFSLYVEAINNYKLIITEFSDPVLCVIFTDTHSGVLRFFGYNLELSCII